MNDLIKTGFFSPVIDFVKDIQVNWATGEIKIVIDVTYIQLDIPTALSYFKDCCTIEYERGNHYQLFKGTFKDWATGLMIYEMIKDDLYDSAKYYRGEQAALDMF